MIMVDKVSKRRGYVSTFLIEGGFVSWSSRRITSGVWGLIVRFDLLDIWI
jgi:hypothetical protein